MTQRIIKILVLAWATLWFAAIVPAHQRGAVSVPGAESSAESCSSCCESEGESSSPDPSDDPVRRCAVCHIVAKLDMPADLSLAPPRFGFVECLSILTHQRVHIIWSQLTVQGRAPPARV